MFGRVITAMNSQPWFLHCGSSNSTVVTQCQYVTKLVVTQSYQNKTEILQFQSTFFKAYLSHFAQILIKVAVKSCE